MYINTTVIKALMHLRGITVDALSNLAQVSRADMHAWLEDSVEDSEKLVAFNTQLEVLQLLGINGEAPRGDVVHYWRIHENLFSKSSDTCWALQVMLRAFGKAQAVFISPDTEPLFCFTAKTHLGLKFDSFFAILEVSAHPLRTLSIRPGTIPDLSWMPDIKGIYLTQGEYNQLEPGAIHVPKFERFLTQGSEASKWARLRDSAIAEGISADQVAEVLQSLMQPAAEHSQEAKVLAPEVPAPVVEVPAEPIVSESVAPVVEPEAVLMAKPRAVRAPRKREVTPAAVTTATAPPQVESRLFMSASSKAVH